MLEVHYAVPGAEAVLVPLNTRLTAGDYSYILEHSRGEGCDRRDLASGPARGSAVDAGAAGRPQVVWVDLAEPARCDYEALLAGALPARSHTRAMSDRCSRSTTPRAPPAGRRA